MSRNNAKSSRIAKVRWVASHPELWDDHSAIVRGMKDAGLVSLSTYHGDVRPSKLIEEAKALLSKEAA